MSEKPPSSYDRIEFFPIYVDRRGYWNPDAPNGTYQILESENLTIEDVSPIIKPNTFSVWAKDCFISKATVSALQGVGYAIVHRYSTLSDRDVNLDNHSAYLIDSAVACLSLIRPTRRSRAGKITGLIKLDGTFDPQKFNVPDAPAEVPEVQKLFTVEGQDIKLLHSILPEFLKLYQRDDTGRITDGYEPIRMAVQLYEQAYSIHYWKARHILWWSGIEALYGNAEEAATARIYALFGNKKLEDGYRCSIYEKRDIPSCFLPIQIQSNHTLGEMVPRILASMARTQDESRCKVAKPSSWFLAAQHP